MSSLETDRVAALVEALADDLSARRRESGTVGSVDDPAAGVRMFNPVVGPASPVAPRSTMEVCGRAVVLRVTLDVVHEGHVGVVHGGVIAALFDDLLGTTACLRVWPSVTSRLVVRFRRPVPVSVPLVLRAVLENVDGRTMEVRGTAFAESEPEVVLASAEASLVELDADQARRMLGSDVRVAGRALPDVLWPRGTTRAANRQA
ncbi:hotdog fold domain-containing protein [Pseudonocardia xishanensis]